MYKGIFRSVPSSHTQRIRIIIETHNFTSNKDRFDETVFYLPWVVKGVPPIDIKQNIVPPKIMCSQRKS